MKLLKRLFREEEGVTLIEYALIAALIAVVAIATIILVGTEIEAVFQNILQNLKTATGGNEESSTDYLKSI